MNFLNSPVAQALGWTLLHFLWEGALIAGLLAIAWLIAPKSSRLRYGLAALAMLAMPLAFAVTFASLLPRQVSELAASTTVANWLQPLPRVPGISARTIPSGIAEAVRWAVPLWIAGVMVFYMRSL